MENAWMYLLKMSCCSAILFAYYRLALYNERFHQWNRFYLLAAMLLSVVVPFLNIPLNATQTADELTTAVSYLPWNVAEATAPSASDWYTILLYVILTVSALLFTRLVTGILTMVRLYYKHKPVEIQHNVQLILTQVQSAPFSFFNWLFWRSDIDPASETGARILHHELTHIREHHSVDKMLSSTLLCFFWMNPFFWLMRKELYIIHEFLADQEAVDRNDGAAFAHMILQGVAPAPGFTNTLINPFFSSNIKRRLFMITSSNHATYSYLRRILGLCTMICSLVVLAFSVQQVQAQQTPNKAKPALKRSASDTGKLVKKEIATTRRVNFTKAGEAGTENINIAIDTVLADVDKHISVRGHGTISEAHGSDTEIELRADNITLSEGKDAPLYIVEGKAVSSALVHALDPNKIASVNVLKGETAKAKYGSKAANGVVVINLKTNVQPAIEGEAVSKVVEVEKAKPSIIFADGKEITEVEMKKIKPEEINSINVWKGPKAIEKFGEKGKDGVIEITLKKPVK